MSTYLGKSKFVKTHDSNTQEWRDRHPPSVSCRSNTWVKVDNKNFLTSLYKELSTDHFLSIEHLISVDDQRFELWLSTRVHLAYPSIPV